MTEPETIAGLFDKLMAAPLQGFPNRGTTLDVSTEHGVYVIYDSRGKVRYVGRTIRKGAIRGGLQGRLTNHRTKYAPKRCKFRFLEIKSGRHRTLLEAYATGHLCPLDLRYGDTEKMTTSPTTGSLSPARPEKRMGEAPVGTAGRSRLGQHHEMNVPLSRTQGIDFPVDGATRVPLSENNARSPSALGAISRSRQVT
jgi:hypothetical protein